MYKKNNTKQLTCYFFIGIKFARNTLILVYFLIINIVTKKAPRINNCKTKKASQWEAFFYVI